MVECRLVLHGWRLLPGRVAVVRSCPWVLQPVLRGRRLLGPSRAGHISGDHTRLGGNYVSSSNLPTGE
jgi:hypothetical protein